MVIAMVADSAETVEESLPNVEKINRVLFGINKLKLIPYLNAGISFRGPGRIEDCGITHRLIFGFKISFKKKK